jgi:adenosine deaminase
MLSTGPSNLHQQLAQLPKVELHRHLEGSLRVATMLELVQRFGLDLPNDETALRAVVQVQPDEPRTSSNFLTKFDTLRMFYRSPEVIQRVTREVIEDAAGDNVRYLELHFTPVAIATEGRFPLAEVVDWVLQATREAEAEFGKQVGLIASVNRHEAIGLAEQLAQIAADRQGSGILGFGLAGDEAGFPADPFRSIIAGVKEAGLGISIHAGEWAGADSVRYAMDVLGSTRIGHGVRVLEDPDVVVVARERRVTFQICLTSNLQSGVVDTLSDHPLPRMIQAGLQVTLNTDDPSVSDICLTDEYRLAVEGLGFSIESLKGMILAAAQASFLSKREKDSLESELLASLFPTD